MNSEEFLSYICDMLCGNLDDVRAEDVNEICSQCKIAQMAGRIKVLPFEPGQTIWCADIFDSGEYEYLNQVVYMGEYSDGVNGYTVLKDSYGMTNHLPKDELNLFGTFGEALDFVTDHRRERIKREQEKQRGIHGSDGA